MPAKKKAKKPTRIAKPARKAMKPAKKAARPAAKVKPAAKPIGMVTHFFDKISVAVVKLHAPLKIGDKIRIEGHGKSVTQTVTSMQIDYEQIKAAKKGQEVGMKTAKPVKAGDLMFAA